MSSYQKWRNGRAFPLRRTTQRRIPNVHSEPLEFKDKEADLENAIKEFEAINDPQLEATKAELESLRISKKDLGFVYAAGKCTRDENHMILDWAVIKPRAEDCVWKFAQELNRVSHVRQYLCHIFGRAYLER